MPEGLIVNVAPALTPKFKDMPLNNVVYGPLKVEVVGRADVELVVGAENKVSITTVPTVPVPEGPIVIVAPALIPKPKEMPLNIVTKGPAKLGIEVKAGVEVAVGAEIRVSITTVPTVPVPEGPMVNVAAALTPNPKEMPLNVVT